ncbi:Ptc7p phosphatase (PP2C family) [Cryptosporidium felis]|nr:Ptc7p phosphatase (PP2C family) [Cryptosporidium felis]
MGIVYRSPAQQHSFNCPFQLSKLPTYEDFPRLQEKGLTCFINLVKSSEDIPQDLPSHSISKEVSVSQSDLIVVGTDGLFDNLFDYEICSICSGAISPYEAIRLLNDPTLYSTPRHISKALANAAYLKSLDPKAKTPFGRQSVVSNEPWQFSSGGKLDDITVVVAWVICEQDQNVLNSKSTEESHSKH